MITGFFDLPSKKTKRKSSLNRVRRAFPQRNHQVARVVSTRILRASMLLTHLPKEHPRIPKNPQPHLIRRRVELGCWMPWRLPSHVFCRHDRHKGCAAGRHTLPLCCHRAMIRRLSRVHTYIRLVSVGLTFAESCMTIHPRMFSDSILSSNAGSIPGSRPGSRTRISMKL